MALRFATATDRLNQAVFKHLANAEAYLDGAPVVGIFDSAYLTDGAGMLGMGGTQPTYLLPSAQVSSDPVGLELVISGKSYFVAQHEPDGTGISRLYLQGNA